MGGRPYGALPVSQSAGSVSIPPNIIIVHGAFGVDVHHVQSEPADGTPWAVGLVDGLVALLLVHATLIACVPGDAPPIRASRSWEKRFAVARFPMEVCTPALEDVVLPV